MVQTFFRAQADKNHPRSISVEVGLVWAKSVSEGYNIQKLLVNRQPYFTCLTDSENTAKFTEGS